ncbi:MAG: hypothetical protein IKJ56_03810 [Bacteroidales bacterium]|nr:hypothetical protein [Bacteroidales bacterium]
MQELYDRYSKGLRRCVDRVYADGSDADLADRFRANVSRFAAYKADYVKTTVSNILNDASIPLKQRQEMADAAVAGFDRYSEAECNTATSRCRTAKQWKEFNDPQRLRLFPNLRWIGTRSANPRQTHKLFEDKVWAKDDDFWKKNMPGQEWNCKCDLEETDDPVTENREVEAKTKDAKVPLGLEGNPTKTGEIFTDRAGYVRNSTSPIEHINNIGRDWLRSIEKNINYMASSSEGAVLIDKHSIHEIAKSSTNERLFFVKNEIALHLDYYLPKAKQLDVEPIDLNHNTKKSKALKRKKRYEPNFLVFEIEIKNLPKTFVAKVGKLKKTQDLELYTLSIKKD